ncbi:hypothetical protein Tco_0822882 [Tanacetum coccineum]|uniref:Uncharacterized protein n=1 Tax=Tanacetum coccineum TaxID=301880 RepID=A0ABQ5AKM6_9ASTR
MSCWQVESLPEDTDVVPFTYNLNGHDIQFGKEEFCLITGLRFGVESSEHYLDGLNPFRRRLFDSHIDGSHITGQMLLDKINGEEFYSLQNDDAVGARPNQRLRPDAFKAKAEWWVSSRAFFDGRIREPPRIPSRVNLQSRYDVPKDIFRRFDEHDRVIKELQENNDAQDKMLNKMYNYFEGFPQGGPKMFAMQASSSFFDVAQMTPTYPTTFEQPMPVSVSSLLSATPHIATPMAQQGFGPWSSTYQAGPLHNRDVGGVNPSPFTSLPETTVAPKKQANNIRNTRRNAKVSPFNLGKAGIDLNAQVEEVMFMGSRATDEYISFHNVDPNKVVHADYVNCMTFLGSPEPVFLDCHIKGFLVEEQFWRGLVLLLCKGANYKEHNPNQIGWLSDDMELMIRARPPGARYIMAKSGTASMHPGSHKFVIEIDEHIMGMSICPSIPEVEFRRISLTGFRSCTSRSHYRSVSKQTTRYPCEASHGHKIKN